MFICWHLVSLDFFLVMVMYTSRGAVTSCGLYTLVYCGKTVTMQALQEISSANKGTSLVQVC